MPAVFKRHVPDLDGSSPVPSSSPTPTSSEAVASATQAKTRTHLPPASYETNTYTLLKLYNLDESVLGSVLHGLTDEQVHDCLAGNDVLHFHFSVDDAGGIDMCQDHTYICLHLFKTQH